MSRVSLLAVFVAGACAGAASTSVANMPPPEMSEGDGPPALELQPREASDSAATVLPLTYAEHRQAESGKADIYVLARGENAFVGRLEMSAGVEVPAHRDATEEFIHVIEGAGTITIDGTSHEIGPGDTVYMPADAEVSYKNGPERMIALQVFAGPEPASKYDAWPELLGKSAP